MAIKIKARVKEKQELALKLGADYIVNEDGSEILIENYTIHTVCSFYADILIENCTTHTMGREYTTCVFYK